MYICNPRYSCIFRLHMHTTYATAHGLTTSELLPTPLHLTISTTQSIYIPMQNKEIPIYRETVYWLSSAPLATAYKINVVFCHLPATDVYVCTYVCVRTHRDIWVEELSEAITLATSAHADTFVLIGNRGTVQCVLDHVTQKMLYSPEV